MWLPWSKPPLEIICPACGAKVPILRDKSRQFAPKPYCGNCGWNVLRARRHLLVQVGRTLIAATLMSAYAWAVTGMKAGMFLVGGWILIVMVLPIIERLRHLPPSRPTPPYPPLGGITDLSTVTLEAAAPRLNILIEGLIVLASAIVILLLPRELDPLQRRFPGIKHEVVFVVLMTSFISYELVAHGMEFLRLVRSIWLENHLAKRAMTVKGRITASDSGKISYEFLDYTSRLLKGMGRDYTFELYEDMPLSVLYDPDKSSLNMPVVGLQFHRQHRMQLVEWQADKR
jgi:hypothetical protein